MSHCGCRKQRGLRCAPISSGIDFKSGSTLNFCIRSRWGGALKGTISTARTVSANIAEVRIRVDLISGCTADIRMINDFSSALSDSVSIVYASCVFEVGRKQSSLRLLLANCFAFRTIISHTACYYWTMEIGKLGSLCLRLTLMGVSHYTVSVPLSEHCSI